MSGQSRPGLDESGFTETSFEPISEPRSTEGTAVFSGGREVPQGTSPSNMDVMLEEPRTGSTTSVKSTTIGTGAGTGAGTGPGHLNYFPTFTAELHQHQTSPPFPKQQDLSSPLPGAYHYPSVPEASLNTLDEPVLDTIQRDLRQIWLKLQLVLHPTTRGRSNALKEWDLWGPLLLCLVLAMALSMTAPPNQASSVFTLIFVIIWCGSGIVTINSKLLGGRVSFFQSVCILGYCSFPLVVCALANLVCKWWFLRILYISVALSWSIYASIGFLNEASLDQRKALALYPIFLFYFIMSWIVLISG